MMNGIKIFIVCSMVAALIIFPFLKETEAQLHRPAMETSGQVTKNNPQILKTPERKRQMKTSTKILFGIGGVLGAVGVYFLINLLNKKDTDDDKNGSINVGW